jgi:hypothetical protein
MKPEILDHLLGTHIYTKQDTYDDNIDFITVSCTFYINSSVPLDVSSELSDKLKLCLGQVIQDMLGVEDKEPHELSEEIEQNKKFDRASKL